MNPVIWIDILLAVLLMPPLVGIPLWLIAHGPQRQRTAVKPDSHVPAEVAPPMAGAGAGTAAADEGRAR